MARLVLIHGKDPLGRQLAEEIFAGQQAEIAAMQEQAGHRSAGALYSTDNPDVILRASAKWSRSAHEMNIMTPTISLPAAVLFFPGAIVTWIAFDTEPPAGDLRTLTGVLGFSGYGG